MYSLYREYTWMHLAGFSAISAHVEHAGGRTQRLQLECKAVIGDEIIANWRTIFPSKRLTFKSNLYHYGTLL